MCVCVCVCVRVCVWVCGCVGVRVRACVSLRHAYIHHMLKFQEISQIAKHMERGGMDTCWKGLAGQTRQNRARQLGQCRGHVSINCEYTYSNVMNMIKTEGTTI